MKSAVAVDETPGYSALRVARRAESAGIEVLPGMSWYVGMDRRAGANHLWMTRLVVQRELGISPVHHHAESEAGIYVLKGASTFFFGPDLRQRIDVIEGDFLFIPAWTIHAEAVRSSDPCEMIMARSTPDPKSVNIHDLKVPEDVRQEAGVMATAPRSS